MAIVIKVNFFIFGGGEIRTHEAISDLAVFKTAALGHYATPPGFVFPALGGTPPAGGGKTVPFNRSGTLPIDFNELFFWFVLPIFGQYVRHIFPLP